MIELKEVSFSYKEQQEGGLFGVNLRIRRGECVLLCGRSGCGKTTVTRLVNGLIPGFFEGELKGEVRVAGRDTAGLAMYELSGGVGSVFQNPRTQFFNVDTDSEIAFGLENRAVPQEELECRVDRTVKELHIGALRGRSIFALSGGEKQKVAFASVYACGPEVFVLDEPSSNLDMASIRELREHLHLIRKQGKTILIAEHRLYYLMDLADRIVYLEQGRIAGEYTPKELAALTEETRRAMGLRAAEPGRLRMEAVRMGGPERPAGTSPLSLELRNLTLGYGRRPVLADISFHASGGEIIAIAGHNGAGKSTISRALCGLHEEREGSLYRNGKRLSIKERQKSAYLVMQDVGYQLFAESVEKECTFGIKRPDKGLAERTLKQLGLYAARGQHPNTLSGGQKQRLAVAVSMVCGREILVFDEPTSGLDYDSMMQVAALMEHLAAEGRLVFVVTHDYELVCRACTRILWLEDGGLKKDLRASRANADEIRKLFGF